jgi:uncharacterized protein YigA (DUF484 family)
LNTPADIHDRRIRDETMREVIGRLTQNAREPDRIGRRVLAWQFKLAQGDERDKLLTFAARLKVTSAAASQAVTAAQEDIHEVRNLSCL